MGHPSWQLIRRYRKCFCALALSLAAKPCALLLRQTLWNSNTHHSLGHWVLKTLTHPASGTEYWRPLTHPASGTEQLTDSWTSSGETAAVGLAGPQAVNHSSKSPSTYKFLLSILLLYRTLMHLPLFYSPAWPWTHDPPASASLMHNPKSGFYR